MEIKELKALCLDRVSNRNMGCYASMEEVDNTIRNMFTELVGTDVMNKREFKRAMRKHGAEIYEIIEDSVDQLIVDSEPRKNAFFANFVEMQSFANGDTNSFYIPSKTELQVARMSRGNWTLERQRVDEGHEITLPMATYGIKVYTEFVTFMSGRIDYPALIAKMAKAFDDFIAQLTYDTFATALSKLPTIFKHSGAYDADKVADVIQSIESANQSQATIIGTKKGLAKIQAQTITSGLLSDGMIEEINRNGFLREWNGTICMELPQGFKAGKLIKQDSMGNDVPDFIFDDDMLFVVCGGEKPVKLYYEGAEMTRSVTEAQTKEDQTLEEEMVINLGCGISYNRFHGFIKLV